MPRIIMVLLVCFLYSCGQATKQDKVSSLANDGGEISKTTNMIGDLPIYNFDQLEPLLNRKDNKTYVINFWATWCAPCVKELPYFEKINAEQKNANVEVVLVSLDMKKMWESHLIPFIEKKDLKSKIVILDDPKQHTWIPKVNEDWSGAIPATIIYNRNKRAFYEQSFTYDELKNHLDKFITQ